MFEVMFGVILAVLVLLVLPVVLVMGVYAVGRSLAFLGDVLAWVLYPVVVVIVWVEAAICETFKPRAYAVRQLYTQAFVESADR